MHGKNIRKWALAILPVLLLLACKHSSNDVQPGTPGPGTGGGGGGGTTPQDTTLCFERDILPIFIANCAKSGCHDAVSRQDGYEFTSYKTITAKKFKAGDPFDTELYEKITETRPDKRMPQPPNAPLTSKEITLIYNWIKEGAKNTTGCTSNCDSNNVTFSKGIQPLVNQYCRGCHNSTGQSGGVNLDNYNGVKAVALDGRLLNAIKHAPGAPAMPRGGNKLSDCQIRQVEKWILAGTLNN